MKWFTRFNIARFAACLVFVQAAMVFADELPLNQLPMYGGKQKTDAMKAADQAFIAGIDKQGLSHVDAARQIVTAGWAYVGKNDSATAMQRFNQAWLLNPENGDIYDGFAVVTAQRRGSPQEVESLFKLALSKPGVAVDAYVNYARFLWTQKELERSMALLNQALQISPKAPNAKSNISFVYYLRGDFGAACDWARQAEQNGDQLEAGYRDDMCRRGAKP